MKLILYSSLLLASFCQAQSYVPEKHQPKMKVQPVVPVKAYSFNLEDVQLLDGPFKTAMEADSRYLLVIEPDRLLADFRTHAGLTAKAKRYGGWESEGLAGHTLGHYLSACSMHYAATHDKRFLDKVNYIIDELAECAPKRNGYLGAIPKEDSVWAEVEMGHIRSRGFDLNGAWSPWYTVHKIMAGLLDAYLYCDNKKALDVETGMANWTAHTIRNLPDSSLQHMLYCEYGGMNDVLVNTYALTGDKKYLDLSYKFYDKRILDPLAKKEDILPGKHSNTQIPKIIASARRYELTGDANDKAIADFFWETVVNNHSYATGGNSNYEYLSEPRKLNDKLTENTTETCNTYNMLKLTRHLFATAPSAMLMDYYEKALYNHILASQNHETGMMCYFVPMRMGGKKEYSDQFDTFTCCVGSGMENHVKYNEGIYSRGADGSVYVNLFIPSVLNWAGKGLSLKQENNLPANDHINFTVNTTKPGHLTIRIRKPHWAANPAISINGKQQPVKIDEHGYIAISRSWKNGDKITFTAPENLYTESLPDNANRRAIFYGPVLLAGILGDKEPDPTKGIPVFVTSETDPNKWLQMVDKNQLTFRTLNTAQPQDVNLIPFNRTKNEYYSVYWDVFTPETWAVQQKAYDEQRKQQQELDARTTDILRVGEMQPERDHSFSGENLTTGEDHQKKWRSTENGGFVSFDMKVDANAVNTLINTYWGMDNRGRVFDIMIDGTKVADVDLNKYKESRFYDVSYIIPAELTKGKQKVTVKFVPKQGNSAGPVYGSRMVKN